MEEVVRRENLQKALKRVCANKSSSGVDRMAEEELGNYLKTHWPGIREEPLQGQYKPPPVKQVMIPKPGGGRGPECSGFLPSWTDLFSRRSFKC